MKVAIDTNVLVAAIHTRGLCSDILIACLQKHRVVLSDYILEEVHRILVTKLNATEKESRAITSRLRSDSEIVVPAVIPIDACRDRSDLPVLGTAVAGNAEVLITGDSDLLEVKEYRGVKVVNPREMAAMIQESRTPA